MLRKKSSQFFYKPTNEEPFARDDSRLAERANEFMNEINIYPSITVTE